MRDLSSIGLISRRSVLAGGGVLVGMAVGGPNGALAQDGTPLPMQESGLDLAAAPPRGSDMPDPWVGWFDKYYFWTDDFPTKTEADIQTIGLQNAYWGVNIDPVSGPSMFTIVYECETEEGAAVLRGLLADPAGFDPDPLRVSILSEDFSETTSHLSIVLDYSEFGGYSIQADILENHGRFVTDIWYDRFLDKNDSANEDLIAEALATPAPGTSVHDEGFAQARTFTDAVNNRLDQLESGTTPAGVNLSWPDRVLQIVDRTDPTWDRMEGYQPWPTFGALDSALETTARTAIGGYYRQNRSIGLEQPPYLAIGLVEWADEAAAEGYLAEMRANLQDVPTPGNTNRGSNRTAVDDPVLSGADETLAFTSSWEDGGTVDSAGVHFRIGAVIYTIDAQFHETSDAALATAIAIAEEQAACAGGGCVAPVSTT